MCDFAFGIEDGDERRVDEPRRFKLNVTGFLIIVARLGLIRFNAGLQADLDVPSMFLV